MLQVNNLVGFGGGAVSPVKFVASATSIAGTITIPAGAQPGDVAILFDVALNASIVPTDVVPTNWTGIITDTDSGGNPRRVRISYKILAAGEPGASVTGMDDTNDDKVMLVFRGNAPITTVSAEDWAAQATTADPSAQTVNASGQLTPLVVFGMSFTGTTAAFSTASPAFDATVAASGDDLLVGYKIYNTAPADHTIDMADLTNNILASGFLEVR